MADKIPETHTLNVEELKRKLLAQRTISETFRVPLTQTQMADLLMAAYQAEVQYRKHEFIPSEELNSHISRLAGILVGEKSKLGIMFCGKCGNGKTTMLSALRAAISLASSCHLWDKQVKLETVSAFDFNLFFNDDTLRRMVRNTPLLAIDDIGTEPSELLSFGNTINPFTELIEFRYRNQLFTVVSTNLTPEEFRAKYKERIADRLNEMMEKFIFTAKTYRGRLTRI